MLRRFTIASLLAALLGSGLWFLYLPTSPAEQRASALSGERWYRLMLGDQQIGYWYTRTHRDYSGRWLFDSEQRFALARDEPVTLRTSRIFAREHPQSLVSAEYLQERRNGVERTLIERTGSTYQATIQHAGGSSPSIEQLDWTYTLDDYLSFEVWLGAANPPPGSARPIASIDFDRLAVVSRVFDVVARDSTGYRISGGSPLADTSIQLDARFAPVSMSVAGLFDLLETDRETALAPRSTLQYASYFVPTDRRLPDHMRTSRLVLGIEGSPNPSRLWPAARQQDGAWQMELAANALGGKSAREQTTAYALPVNDHRIVALVQSILSGSEVQDSSNSEALRAQALLKYVHDYLRYAPGTATRPVLDLLDDPVGDCTEFADLLTTLARAAGLESHTVFGLAYSDAAQPAFAFHAWNEIRIDGKWQALDPTWNQYQVDATHIPLPVNQGAALQLLTGALDLRFTIEDVEYFD